MTDDARRPLTEEERARLHAVRAQGGICALCGRTLAADEPVWVVRVDAYGDGRAYWRAPVGRECAPPGLLSETEGLVPERCAGCGLAMYYLASYPRRRMALCSKRCDYRYRVARRKEARGS